MALSDAGVLFLGLAVTIAGWLQAKRLGLAAAEKAAREARGEEIASTRAMLEDARIEARVLKETISADEREDKVRDRSLDECLRERDRERGISKRLAEMVDVAWAAQLVADAEKEGK
jgi:Flp pilus assembly protein TadB